MDLCRFWRSFTTNCFPMYEWMKLNREKRRIAWPSEYIFSAAYSPGDYPSCSTNDYSEWIHLGIFFCVFSVQLLLCRIIQMDFMQHHFGFIGKLKFQLGDCMHSLRKYFESVCKSNAHTQTNTHENNRKKNGENYYPSDCHRPTLISLNKDFNER